MHKLPYRSIKSLYALALAEGEGVGTAYEYFAKRLAMSRWLPAAWRPRRLLVAGLPQKYGLSFDFWLLAAEWGAALTIADERPAALQKAREALDRAQEGGLLPALRPQFVLVGDWPTMAELPGDFDLALSSELLQRLPPPARMAYTAQLQARASLVGLFCPNAENAGHTNVSGLTGLRLEEAIALNAGSGWRMRAGFVDMPPFPPGVTRSEAQRAQASSGRLEGAAMWGLEWYARLEWWMPASIRRAQSHIIYALMQPTST
ncbi:MAG: hypothetical protein KC418_20145 [Anaerolineales bacterium]|nr:hypothetical protein [Anaerolineales bacterium]MCB8951653.1 hypothetical protein [Ardenticatenales bacterium]